MTDCRRKAVSACKGKAGAAGELAGGVKGLPQRSPDTEKSMERRDQNGLTEAEFLAAYREKAYPKPSLTADIAVFAVRGDVPHVLLICRGRHPYLGCWALPGGFANPMEPLEATAARELLEETGIASVSLRPVGLFSAPGRDPRGWVVSQAYAALVDWDAVTPRAGDDAAQACWFACQWEGGVLTLRHDGVSVRLGYAPSANGYRVTPLSEERLAFDHGDILVRAAAILFPSFC